MKTKLLLPIFLFLICGFASASTTVSSVISSNQVWTPSGSPYLINSQVIINQGVTVTIKPGVEVIASASYKLTVNGCLIAIGNKDSLVKFKALSIVFSDTAMDYNPSTKTGCQIKYCSFDGPLSGNELTLDRTSLIVEYSHFNKINYPIGSTTSDSITLWVSHCNFTGDGFGFLIYGLKQNTSLYFTDNLIHSYGYVALAENSIIKNNYFYGDRYYASISSFTNSKKAIISCNYFKNGKYPYSGAIDLSSVNNYGCNFKIENNEFDSMAIFINMPCYYYTNDTININNNNFMNYTYKAVFFNSCSSTTGTYHFSDFTSNYWNTNDTTKIKGSIMDFRTDKKIPFMIDFTSFRSSKTSNCWPSSSNDAGMIEADIKPTTFSQVNTRLYPNPANNTLNVETNFNGNSQLKVIDVTGQVVKTQTIQSQLSTLDISSLKSGLYFIEITSADGRLYKSRIVHY